MPELPEVEIMTRRLRSMVGSQARIVESQIFRGEYLPGQEQHDIAGALIEGIFRRGKFIVFKTDRGLLVCHNAMSGYWDSAETPWTFDYVEGVRETSEKDVRVSLGVQTPNGSVSSALTLRFHDARLFGSLRFYPLAAHGEVKSLKFLGPEAIRTEAALLPDYNWSVLDTVLFGGSKKPIKQLLMEQEMVAGIGNIYAAEALWRAGVNPHRQGRDLDTNDLSAIFDGVQGIMTEAITFGLDYEKYLKVYRKKNCPRCGDGIVAGKIKGRSSYYCERCQV